MKISERINFLQKENEHYLASVRKNQDEMASLNQKLSEIGDVDMTTISDDPGFKPKIQKVWMKCRANPDRCDNNWATVVVSSSSVDSDYSKIEIGGGRTVIYQCTECRGTFGIST